MTQFSQNKLDFKEWFEKLKQYKEYQIETNDWNEAEKYEKLIKKAVSKIRDAYFDLIKENGINLSLGKYLAKY